ncbi:protein IWS1 homolog 1-like [Durio zibethinus]|uniref:Protein IWS1 homolog 1-like n=1 Tax=Durio zibethinus TaxID=66656 RepID=A0A6P5ZL82_DURZI|nr:protein IWS1 homolog 1-like [Durio zibethinus]
MVYHPFSRKDSLMKNQGIVEEKKRKGGKDFHGDDPEINAMFDAVKRRRKIEKSSEEIILFVEKIMAELELVAEDDAQLNRIGQPAINKLRKLPFLTEVLSKKSFQLEFLDCGVLTLLKNWLEPLPDGSLPNATIRGTILNILTDFPLDLKQQERREQLKKSGLGRVIMFLSRSEEETTSNKKLAKDLIDKWSRIIFNKSTSFADLRSKDDVNVPVMKKSASKPAILQYIEADLDFNVSKEQKLSSGPSSSSQAVTRAEPTPMVYVVNPQSKCNPEVFKAYARQQVQGDSRQRIANRLKQLKASKKKPLQAEKPSAQGRRMLPSF